MVNFDLTLRNQANGMNFIKSSLIVVTVFLLNDHCGITQNLDVHHLYCLGNLADIEDKSIVSNALAILLEENPDQSSVLFLGDFVDGLITNLNQEQVTADLRTLFEISQQFPGTKFFAMQGDRDWDHSRNGGWANAKLLEDIVEDFDFENVEWVNDKGCPGPKLLDLADYAKVIAINSQWWNHPFRKPTPESIDCKISTKEGCYEELEDFLLENNNSHIAIAAHFPILSYGNYNGYFSALDWLKPFPVIGSFLKSYRQNIGESYDLINSNFSVLRDKLLEVNEISQSLIFLSGHEHNTQIIRSGENFHINVGLGDQQPFVRKHRDLLYQNSSNTIVRISFYRNGTSRTRVIDINSLQVDFERELLGAPCNINTSKFVNHQFEPCGLGYLDNSGPKQEGIKLIPGGGSYSANGLKKFFLGEHYRPSWTTNVQVAPLPFDLYGGLDPYEPGGGRQTKSLKFIGGNGKQYVFRSVDKDPSKALSYILRKTTVAKVVQDQTTTQHPYGALVAASLLDHTNILHVKPQLFYLPDHPGLHIYRNDYKGMLGMLEERPSSKVKDGSMFGGADDIMKTAKMFRYKFKNLKNDIALNEYLEARMFDILVGDWGKHEDNWKWAAYREKKDWHFRPIPRDRDHVFSRWDGILPWLVDREWAKPSGENFKEKIKGLRSLVWQARHQDRFLTQEATRADWIAAARALQKQISETDIETSVNILPAGVRELDAAELNRKLIQRKKDLVQYATEMYEMLALTPDIVGSDKGDFFQIETDPTQKVRVRIYNNADMGKLYFDRTFLPGETKELRIFGLGGKDHYVLSGKSNQKIKLRLIPGESNDIIEEQYERRGSNHVTVYTRQPNEVVSESSQLRFYRKNHQDAYDYGRTEFKFNRYIPLFYTFFSGDDGLGIKAGVSFRNQKYGKPDFSSSHRISGGVTTLGNYNIELTSRYRHVLAKWDLQFSGRYQNHRVYNSFFGLGNNTEKDEQLFINNFYQLQFNNGRVSTSLIKEFARRSVLNLDFGFEHIGGDQKENNIIENGSEMDGAQSMDFWFASQGLDLDFRDHKSLPYRGNRLQLQLMNALPVSDRFEYFGRFHAALESFHSIMGKFPFTMGLKLGASSTWGDTPLQYRSIIGLSENLRGFRKRRFTGKDAVFVNLDFRWQILAKSNFFLPIKFGLKAFYDTGYVTYGQESTRSWKHGYGVGFFIVPYAENLTINLLAGFSEEESGLIQFSLGRIF